jgi:superfamily I DNA/RNA helicase
MLRYSEEQEAILSSPAGFNMVVANAGVGKTEISAEFIVRAYLEEEKKLKPGGRLTGQEQLELIKQFKVISFTVKAAGELTTRVYRKFNALGIPVPQRDGKEVPLARTCDAYLQRWLSHPLVMTLWLKQWSRWADRLTEVLNTLPPALQKKLMAHYDRGEWRGERALQTHWGCLMGEPVKDALVTVACLRHALVPGWQKVEADLRALVETAVKDMAPGEPRQWSANLEAKIVGLVSKFSLQWEAAVTRLESLSLEAQVSEEARLKPWLNLKTLRTEFMQLYDVSRSIGYHPHYCPEALASKMLLERLCTMDKLNSFGLFQTIAADYENFKLLALKMDFGDYMQAVKTTFERNPYLLEKDKEYPRLGFRAKYLVWDEAQDNSMWQYWILNLLCGSSKSKFHCLVLGDPKQAIYGFRGGNAEEFVRNIKFLKTHAQQHLFGLTTSYRSCQKIIALGNEVARLLPAGKVEALDSKGVYHEEGAIHMAPPLRDAVAELAYVKKEYAKIRRDLGPGSSVMLLVRSNLEEHPAYVWVQQQKDRNMVILTHHRSKGLEADHVFLLGLTAGRFPEPRSTMRDEVNLFYVAVTRARMALHLCCPQIMVSEGEERVTGISPFVSLVPTLKDLALGAGWEEEALKLGERAHKALVAAFLSKQKARKTFLLKELGEKFPAIPSSHYTRQNSMDTGARWKRQFRDPDKRHIAPKPLGV